MKRRRIATDLVVVGVLTVIAFLVRRHGLPTHGLWLDDAVEGAARKAPVVSADNGQPGSPWLYRSIDGLEPANKRQ